MKAIRKDMMIGEAISVNPAVADVLLDRGIHCIGCGGMTFETLEQGLKAHGVRGGQIDKIVEEINKPKALVITTSAEDIISGMMKKKNYKYLRLEEKDKEIKEKGIKVIFDKKYAKKFKNIMIDYSAGAGGFTIK